ncbi:MAG: putative SAM-dependent methyltransferase [Bacteroidetes bacterium]|nr:putative SAM-dependent methyltransferase [Bacteroidota bacterium]
MASCPLCGTGSTELRWTRNRTRYFVCRSCRTVFQFPQPAPDALKEVYSEDYYRKNEGNPSLSSYTDYDIDMDLSLARGLLEPVRALNANPGGRFLDLGCATGQVLLVAREYGWQAAGVELSAWAAERARKKGFDVYTGTLEEARYAEGSMDVVTMFDVIEHIPDPRATLREIRRILRPGGALVLQTPNADGFGARVLYRSRSMIVQPDAHLILFSPSGIRRMLEQEGFDVARLSTHSLSGTLRSYAATVLRRSVKKVLKAMNYNVGGVDLTRWIKRGDMTELPQFSFNDVIQVTALRRHASP